ncbi:MAG TPA: four helix bundle protein [Balneolales bacterium]|nr:four helix bundle protein [Balneolales bacterium]
MKQNIIQNKSYDFAVRVIRMYQLLTKEKKEFALSKQFLKSDTSIGANVEEAIGGSSKKDFSQKNENCVQRSPGYIVLVAITKKY